MEGTVKPVVKPTVQALRKKLKEPAVKKLVRKPESQERHEKNHDPPSDKTHDKESIAVEGKPSIHPYSSGAKQVDRGNLQHEVQRKHPLVCERPDTRLKPVGLVIVLIQSKK
jgi:hypothetical protein